MIFFTALSVLFPLFGKIGLGFALKHFNLVSLKSLKEFNSLVFKIFLPALLFISLYQTDFSTITSYDMLLFSFVTYALLFALYFFIVPFFVKENSQRGVMIQGMTRSNFIFFGFPLAVNLYGGISVGVASLMVGMISPLLNISSVVALETFRGKKPDFSNIFSSIFTNPVILASLLGFLGAISPLKLPNSIEIFLEGIGDLATPLALIILGGSISHSSVKLNLKPLIVGIINKLIVIPAIGLTAALLFGFRGLELLLLLALFASPASISSYTMAQQMDGDADLAGQLVLFTTVLSLVTLLLWISSFMALGYI